MHATIYTPRAVFAAGFVTISLLGCSGPNRSTATDPLWWDTTNSVSKSLTAARTDTLYHSVVNLVTTQGRGSQLVKFIDPKNPIRSVHYLDPYCDIYDSSERYAPIINEPQYYNDNPYGLVLEQTYDGARILNIHRTRRFRVPLSVGQTIFTISGHSVTDLSEDELALALYRAATKGAVIEAGHGLYKRRLKLPPVHDFQPQFITATMLDHTTGYVRFDRFTVGIDAWVKLVTQNLVDNGATSLVIDLRGNRGGAVASCFNTMKLFMLNTAKDTLFCAGLSDVAYFANHHLETPFFNLPLIILVDRHTASAAEIFAGTMQDRDRAIIVGEQTFGKAMTVNEFELPYGMVFWMSTGRVFLPSGRCYELPYYGNERCFGRLTVPGNIENFDHNFEAQNAHYSIWQYQSRNLHRALFDWVAIVPDYIAPCEVSENTAATYLPTLLPKWLAYQYAWRILTENERDSLVTYYTPDTFDSAYAVPIDLMKQILRYKDLYDLQGDVESILSLEPEIAFAFRNALAEELFGMRRYSSHRLLNDPVVEDALRHRDVATRMLLEKVLVSR